MKIQTFEEYSVPFENKCKDRNIKFTNKNRERLRTGPYFDMVFRKHGLSGLFRVIYTTRIVDIVPDGVKLYEIVTKK